MTIESKNPATGNVIKTYVEYDDQDIEATLARTQSAYEAHKKTSFSDRRKKMLAVADYLETHKEKLGELATNEMGKTRSSAIGEVEKCASLCRFYAENAEEFLSDHHIDIGAKESYVRYRPIGAILAVMPWNFPYWQVFRFAVPALMAGNVGILKHASNVPGCALAIEEAFIACGFDKGEFQTLLIGSAKVERLIQDDRIRAVTLTGSEAAGSIVAAQAGKALKKTVLELGGSDPFIIMPSADTDKTVDLAVKGRVQNNGQTCIAAKRYIIHKDVYDTYKAKLIERFEALIVGDPMEDATDVGPLSSASIRDELNDQVEQSIKQGAVRLCGAEVIDGAGNYYKPGLLENLPKESVAYKDELFGPVGLLFKVNDINEAIALANDTRFGLGSVICSEDAQEIEAAINDLDAGATFVNGTVASHPAMPFGGVKASGYGRELSAEGIREFTNIKSIVLR